MTETPQTTLEYALLGLLGAAPMSGYDVHRLFADSPLAHFSSSPGAIYPALKRLAGRGLLSAALDRTTEARPRRVFSLTTAGREALETWLRQPVTREELVRGGGAPVLRFSLCEGYLSPAEVVAYLQGWRDIVSGYLSELERYQQAMAAATLYARLSLDAGAREFRSQLAWIESAITIVAAADAGQPAGLPPTREEHPC